MAEPTKVIREITVNVKDINYGVTVGNLLRSNDRAADKEVDRAKQNLKELESLIAVNNQRTTPIDKNTKLTDLADKDGNIRIPLFDADGERLFDAAKMGSIVKATGYAQGSDLKEANAQRQAELQKKRDLTGDIQIERMAEMTAQIGAAQFKRYEEEQAAKVAGAQGQGSVVGSAAQDVPTPPPAKPKDPLAGFVAHETQEDLVKPAPAGITPPKEAPRIKREDTTLVEKIDALELKELDDMSRKFGEKGSKVKYVGSGPQGAKDGSKENLAVQGALAYLGYDLGDSGKNKDGVDGDVGSKTRAAIVKFQQDNGIEPDGRAGKDTVAKLKEKVAQKQEQDKAKGKTEPDKAEEKTGTITIKPEKDMQIADLANKLGVDDNKKADFLKAVHDATKTQGTEISKGQTVTIDADSMGITPSEAKAAQGQGVEVKSAGR